MRWADAQLLSTIRLERRLAPAPGFLRATGAVAPAALFVLLLALAWELMAGRLHSPLIPSLGQVARELDRLVQGGLLLPQLAITLARVGAGFTIAFVLALVTGIAMGRNRWLRRFLEPAVLIGLTVPGLVWALLCVIWFGVGFVNPIVAVALSAAPAIALNVAQGVRAVDVDLIEMAHVFNLSPAVRLRSLWLPAITPFLLSGARFGLSLAWKVIVLVEIFGMSSGVGYQLNSAFSSQNVAAVLAWTVAFGVAMAILEYGILQPLERRATRWRRSEGE
ncbi:MAG TPA: ABC transporter permease [Candidatus Acidoferrum sp.]|jgi:NitT/TauT family transport system permease protein|nr:ABC transporter permease [Candidatus Acidoferrum sp.]